MVSVELGHERLGARAAGDRIDQVGACVAAGKQHAAAPADRLGGQCNRQGRSSASRRASTDLAPRGSSSRLRERSPRSSCRPTQAAAAGPRAAKTRPAWAPPRSRKPPRSIRSAVEQNLAAVACDHAKAAACAGDRARRPRARRRSSSRPRRSNRGRSPRARRPPLA